VKKRKESMSNDTNLEDYFTNPNFDVEAVKKVVLGLGLPLLILWLVITPLLLLLVTRVRILFII